jgi:hypothetical protein
VAQDSVASVREHVALMISDWLTTLPDRYDYETRLLPYLLTFLCDPVPVSGHFSWLLHSRERHVN